jgi:hypothetical protein
MTDTATFRVIKTTKIGFVDPHGIEEVIWVGRSIGELSEKYPPSNVHDPLDYECTGMVQVDYRFEQWGNGRWMPIKDPRRRVTPLSQRERALHRQNFPGDYVDENGLKGKSFPSRTVSGTVSCPSCGEALLLVHMPGEER